MSKQSEAAFEIAAADQPTYLSYTKVERQMYLNGYDQARLDAKKEELKELTEQPGGSREDGL